MLDFWVAKIVAVWPDHQPQVIECAVASSQEKCWRWLEANADTIIGRWTRNTKDGDKVAGVSRIVTSSIRV